MLLFQCSVNFVNSFCDYSPCEQSNFLGLVPVTAVLAVIPSLYTIL